MASRRQVHGPEFEGRAALEAVRGIGTASELASWPCLPPLTSAIGSGNHSWCTTRSLVKKSAQVRRRLKPQKLRPQLYRQIDRRLFCQHCLSDAWKTARRPRTTHTVAIRDRKNLSRRSLQFFKMVMGSKECRSMMAGWSTSSHAATLHCGTGARLCRREPV